MPPSPCSNQLRSLCGVVIDMDLCVNPGRKHIERQHGYREPAVRKSAVHGLATCREAKKTKLFNKSGRDLKSG